MRSISSLTLLLYAGPHNASAYSVKTPSPKAICPQLDGAGKPDNRSRRSSSSVQLSERRQSSHSEVNSTHSNNFIASKAKNRTRSVFGKQFYLVAFTQTAKICATWNFFVVCILPFDSKTSQCQLTVCWNFVSV